MVSNVMTGLSLQWIGWITGRQPAAGCQKRPKKYRARQAELISGGKFKEAIKMDIDDIHSKFGDKYDGAIQEMLDYAKSKGYISDQKGLLND